MSEKKDENKKGCLGCLGIIVLIILVFGGCNALFGNDEDKQKNDAEKQTQKTTEEQSIKQDDKTQQKEKKESKTSETKKEKVRPEDNTVYGKLTKKHNNNNPVVIDDMTYILGDNDDILQAEKDFSNLPLNKNTDKNFLNEHAKDLMAKDAEFVSNKSDTEQKYHSESLNKDYYVTLSLTDKGKVKSLIVSSFE